MVIEQLAGLHITVMPLKLIFRSFEGFVFADAILQHLKQVKRQIVWEASEAVARLLEKCKGRAKRCRELPAKETRTKSISLTPEERTWCTAVARDTAYSDARRRRAEILLRLDSNESMVAVPEGIPAVTVQTLRRRMIDSGVQSAVLGAPRDYSNRVMPERLDSEFRDEIEALIATGEYSQREIARRFGLGRKTIIAIGERAADSDERER